MTNIERLAEYIVGTNSAALAELILPRATAEIKSSNTSFLRLISGYKQMVETVLVTPQEAIRLAAERPGDDIIACSELLEAYKNTVACDSDTWWYTMKLLATVWNAGRIQGIRAERKRRR